jgi:hypothetical protein
MSPARKPGADAASPADLITCPWCSASVPATAATCPSCGAALRDAADGDIAGVTQIDPAAILKTRRIKPRGRLMSLLTGDGPEEDESGGKVEPPSDEVRREMLKLELAALDAELETKAQQAAAQRDLLSADAAEPVAPAAPAPVTPSEPPSDASGAKSG